MKRALIAILVLSITAIACSKPETPAPQTQQQPTMPPQSAPQGMQQGQAPAAAIAYDLPSGWTRVAPSSSMRIDQATIAGPAGNGDLAVFFFGVGGGGPVEDNLTRWADQMVSTAPPKREAFDAGAYKVTWLDISGTLKPSSMGMGPATDQPNSRMFAAVVEGEGGPWFFKATGPDATMAQQRDAFVAMLKSVRAMSNV
jgi:hypothetical protein